ncbi:hypothetical protein Cfor_10835 [Coptotermes formosanus]|uniref:EDRF1 N-terminal domain-containing protein n=1 Tax=Coptotermes formosanus TaxID=36987 RepID=A0A6L2PDK1_COPFO|nr:hypothetical protein Cfor_10835 [Coptotermes formosanus]
MCVHSHTLNEWGCKYFVVFIQHSLEVQEDARGAENWRLCPSPDSPRKSVKSTAVVKYSSVQSYANFALLQCNTDLNLPPSNWLSSSAESYGLQYVPSHSSGFSSFRMAHMFLDCVGEVDVVSDAENIKKLLKIPYSKGPVSMMVHRIENTLLIDEFDIHKHLLRTAETEWEWLKKFFFDHVLKSLSDKEKRLFHKNKSRCVLQQKTLLSKFLYHSLAVAEPEDQKNEIQEQKHISAPLPAWPPLPEPRPEENLPDPRSNHKFARNVVWTFEDIQMLIGTDMPIFGAASVWGIKMYCTFYMDRYYVTSLVWDRRGSDFCVRGMCTLCVIASVDVCVTGGTEMLLSSAQRVKWVLRNRELALAAADT